MHTRTVQLAEMATSADIRVLGDRILTLPRKGDPRRDAAVLQLMAEFEALQLPDIEELRSLRTLLTAVLGSNVDATRAASMDTMRNYLKRSP